MSQKSSSKVDWIVLKRVVGLARPFKSLFFFTGILAVVLAPLGIARPYLINVIVDDYIFKFDLPGLLRMVIIFVFILLISAVFRYIFIYTVNLLGLKVTKDLRVDVFNHIISLKLAHFDKTPIGQSTTRTINDVETINRVFSEGMITIIADLLGLIAVLAIMFYTSVKLTLICLTTLPLLIIASYIFKEKVKSAFQIVRAQIAKMNSFLQERITGMKTVQIFNSEKQEMDKFRVINREYTQANLDTIFYYAVFFPVVELISALSLALMVWWGARGVLSNEVTIGALVAFPIYLGMLFRPIRMLADKFNTLQMGLVAAERVFDILDREDHIENVGTVKKNKIAGDVSFENVVFSYNGKTEVLKDISFDIPAGTSMAIVGSTGSGKTTIINVLNRFYEIESGKVSIDGIDIKDFDLISLRRRMAMVLQDVFLFTGSVMENIKLRDSTISDEEVIEASKTIGAHPFLESLPGGYNYNITERGLNLSMGQRQLISFVRALVFDPDILILDEATSSIDTETETIIQHAIETLIEKRTSIIIAHRLSTIKRADSILVMDHGVVMEKGNHEELMKNDDGIYQKLYKIQFEQILV